MYCAFEQPLKKITEKHDNNKCWRRRDADGDKNQPNRNHIKDDSINHQRDKYTKENWNKIGEEEEEEEGGEEWEDEGGGEE